MPGPWPIPPVRTSTEVKASSLDSDVQELFGTLDLSACGLTNDVQLQWAAPIEFPRVERMFKLIFARLHSQRLVAKEVRHELHIFQNLSV